MENSNVFDAWLFEASPELFWLDDVALFRIAHHRGDVEHVFILKNPSMAHSKMETEYLGSFFRKEGKFYCKKRHLSLFDSDELLVSIETLESLTERINSSICHEIERKVNENPELFLALDYRSEEFAEMEARFVDLELDSQVKAFLVTGQTELRYVSSFTGRMCLNFLRFLEKYALDPDGIIEEEIMSYFDDNQDEVVYQLRTQWLTLKAVNELEEIPENVQRRRKINEILLSVKLKKVHIVYSDGEVSMDFDIDKTRILGSENSYPISVLTKAQQTEFVNLFKRNFFSLSQIAEIKSGKRILYVKGE